MKTWKKIVAIGIIGVFALSGLAGCTNKTPFSQEDVDREVNNAVTGAELKKDVTIEGLTDDITTLGKTATNNTDKITDLERQKKALEEQATRDAQVIEDYKAAEVEEEKKEVSVGELIDEIEFGQVIQVSLDDTDLPFFDGKIDFDDEDYDAHEEFNLDLLLAFNGFGFEEDFYENPYFIFGSEDLKYIYSFDDNIQYDDITEDEPLEINFLGQTMTIVEADDDSITIKSGTPHDMRVGETKEIDGGILEVLFIDSDAVKVSYNGESVVIDEDKTKNVGGLDIRAEDIMTNNLEGIVTLTVGTDVIKTLDDGDEWIEDDERFVFGINTDGDELESLSLYWDLTCDELDDDYPPLGLGDFISFPEDFITVSFESLEEVTYETCEVYFDDIDANDELLTDENAVIIKCKETLITVGDEDDIKKMFIISNGDYYYYDDDKDIIKGTGNEANIVNDDLELEILFSGGKLKFKDSANKKIRFDTDITNMRFGLEEEEAETDDVKYAGNEFGKLDGDLLTQTGLIVKNVESNAENDEATLLIPDAEVLANLRVSLV